MAITKQEFTKRLENFEQTSRDYKLPLTPQKTAIFRMIANSCSHPNAQEIYEELKASHPNISLATVYKNLDKFQKLNLIIEIPVPNGCSRYDAKLDTHSHAVDTATGQVIDLKTDYQLELPSKIMGKPVKRINIIYYI